MYQSTLLRDKAPIMRLIVPYFRRINVTTLFPNSIPLRKDTPRYVRHLILRLIYKKYDLIKRDIKRGCDISSRE